MHELGHNHQNGDWTFDGTGEVTNNLIVLHIHDKVLGLRFDGGHPAIRDRQEHDKNPRVLRQRLAPRRVEERPVPGPDDVYPGLSAFGSAPFRSVFAEYARLPEADRPRSDDQSRHQWLVRLSTATGKNLGPFFQGLGRAHKRIGQGVGRQACGVDAEGILTSQPPPAPDSIRETFNNVPFARITGLGSAKYRWDDE